MDLFKHQNAEIKLSLEKEGDLPIIAQICEALGNETRLKILKILQRAPHLQTLQSLSKELNIPKTTLLHHLNVMEKANIVAVTYKSNNKTTARFFGRDARSLFVNFYYNEEEAVKEERETQELGIGQFVDFFGESFGFCTETDDYSFMVEKCFSPQRYGAQLIWTNRGIITYYFNNNTPRYHNVTELSLSLEICSEAPYFDNEQKSDITFWINGKEITTYVCQGDYGDRRGLLTPTWWGSHNTQYGKLVTLTVTNEGVFLNGAKTHSKVTLKDLNLARGNKTVIQFGNKDTTEHPGGFNIFGKAFGDYPQNIKLTFKYKN